MSIIRQFELSENPLPASFDLIHLRAIHRHLFQDDHAWAGELRRVDMVEGSNRFGSHLHIENHLSKAFVKLVAKRDLWRNSHGAVDWAEQFSHISVKSTRPIVSENGTDVT